MEVSELRQVRRNLDRFLRRFEGCIKMKPTRRHLRTYVRGQVSDLERKSVEPIALDAGVAPRTLQEFLGLHRWDHEALRRRIGEVIQRDHADENAIAVIDETSCPKKGDKTAGVQRQYCGATGKTDNCVVTVHLGYATNDFHALVDSDLYLPKETWHEDRERCREAGIPDEVVYRPKWRIALELLQRAVDGGMRFRYLTADEEYGSKPGFRHGVAALGLTYMIEVPCSTFGWTKKPSTVTPGAYLGIGRPRRRAELAPGAPRPRRVDRLSRRGGPRWQAFHIKEAENGPVVWEARAVRFFVSENTLPSEECRLIVARNTADGEVKYFLSNAPENAPLKTLLHVAFSRWCIQRIFQDAKMQVGFDHFEVRRYLPLMRHLILSMVSLLFLMKETQRLRGEKCVVERAPGAPGRGGATRPEYVVA